MSKQSKLRIGLPLLATSQKMPSLLVSKWAVNPLFFAQKHKIIPLEASMVENVWMLVENAEKEIECLSPEELSAEIDAGTAIATAPSESSSTTAKSNRRRMVSGRRRRGAYGPVHPNWCRRKSPFRGNYNNTLRVAEGLYGMGSSKFNGSLQEHSTSWPSGRNRLFASELKRGEFL